MQKGCEVSVEGQYAPTLRYHDGTFYIIGTNYGGGGSQGISYVTAQDPACPWSDPVCIGEWYVDPSLEFVGDTFYYLSPDNAGNFLLATMDPATGKFTSPLKTIASGLGGSSPEGLHFYKVNDYYYVMSAEGGTGYEHREVVSQTYRRLNEEGEVLLQIIADAAGYRFVAQSGKDVCMELGVAEAKYRQEEPFPNDL